MDGFRRELGVTENEALDLIGRSVTIAKQAREQYTPRKVCIYLIVGKFGRHFIIFWLIAAHHIIF